MNWLLTTGFNPIAGARSRYFFPATFCSGCGDRRPGYDRSPERLFEFIPMWGHKVFFRYAPRRVNCPDCGVRVEWMPWVSGKRRLTEAYAWFLSGWAKRLSWKEVAEAFRTTWDHVFCSVERAVSWGREHQDLSGVEAIGIDEIQWQRVSARVSRSQTYQGVRLVECCNAFGQQNHLLTPHLEYKRLGVSDSDPLKFKVSQAATPTSGSQYSTASLAPVDKLLVGLRQRLEKQMRIIGIV